MKTGSIESFIQLKDKKIVNVHVHGINSVSLETEDGKWFLVETECIQSSLHLYGMRVYETNPEELMEDGFEF